MSDYNIQKNVLIDLKGKKIAPWKEKKQRSILLSQSYYRLKLKKFDRVADCSSFLEFHRFTDNTLSLNYANFCRDRLCPMCSWRRSLKIFGQTSKILNYLESNNSYRYIFLTLTVKNVFSFELSETIDKMFKGFNLMFKYQSIKRMCKGTFRALEVTYNKTDGSFHPHFHIIIAVNKSYFDDKKQYLKHDDFKNLWKKAMDLDYEPQVNVKAFSKNWTGVAEASKYSVKDSDFLISDNEELTDKLVSVFDSVLKGRRLAAYTGDLKKAHKILNLDDCIDGSLIHTDDDSRPDLDYVIEVYNWNIGISNYSRL